MENVWFTPKGYQRTSQKLQRRCLEQLLSFGEIKGKILDVGCGTGNSLLFISRESLDYYLGIDISDEMINFAIEHQSGPNIRFKKDNFLNHDLSKEKAFDVVICAACLHWFIPEERQVIEKIFYSLRPGGKLFLSCAFNFEFFNNEADIQGQVLAKIRDKYETIAPLKIFDNFRFDKNKISVLFSKFHLENIYRIEESVNFDNYEDFRDWHLGSGSVLYHQFPNDVREAAVQEFYKILYDSYRAGGHKISYSTALMLLIKTGEQCTQA